MVRLIHVRACTLFPIGHYLPIVYRWHLLMHFFRSLCCRAPRVFHPWLWVFHVHVRYLVALRQGEIVTFLQVHRHSLPQNVGIYLAQPV